MKNKKALREWLRFISDCFFFVYYMLVPVFNMVTEIIVDVTKSFVNLFSPEKATRKEARQVLFTFLKLPFVAMFVIMLFCLIPVHGLIMRKRQTKGVAA